VHLDTCGDQSASEIGGLVGAQSADAAHISGIYKVERALAGIPELVFSVQGLTQSLYAHSKLEDTMLSTDVPALRARAQCRPVTARRRQNFWWRCSFQGVFSTRIWPVAI